MRGSLGSVPFSAGASLSAIPSETPLKNTRFGCRFDWQDCPLGALADKREQRPNILSLGKKAAFKCAKKTAPSANRCQIRIEIGNDHETPTVGQRLFARPLSETDSGQPGRVLLFYSALVGWFGIWRTKPGLEIRTGQPDAEKAATSP